MTEPRDNNDLVLAPGEYSFHLDRTKGLVSVDVGPFKLSLSQTDQMVVFDTETRRFQPASKIGDAIRPYVNASEGSYIVLTNPAPENEGKANHPKESNSVAAIKLQNGSRINIPGPANFPLWPGEEAKVIPGHHLRHNQYLLVRVYNDSLAQSNWDKGIIKRQTTAQEIPVPPPVLTMGQLLVIKGTDVSFYIPPTGIEVLPERDQQYVRDAVSLERLEYCILLSESGEKRYVKGPAVVFPEPIEDFVKDNKNNRKFRAIELNENSGLYIKVIATYEDEGKTYNEGDELFITGEEQAIYFPRSEHTLITYGGSHLKHYAVAIPKGEGRYVLDRNTGMVTLVKGPQMFLPDPRREVLVKRVLDEKTVSLFYPSNARALQINRQLMAEMTANNSLDTAVGAAAAPAMGAMVYSGNTSMNNASLYHQEKASDQFGGDSLTRGSTFTPPRTITLDTKYEGAVSVNVWTGYAVMVVDKAGNRRVVLGPATILLEYDETLMHMELSTGKPKTTDNLMSTAFLQVSHNKVSDYISCETKDLVPVDVSVSYRVNFEGEESEKWFSVENYVKFMCDHLRSVVRNSLKHVGIEEFYSDPITLVRNAVLGETQDGKRTGRSFEENSMRIYDVEVLGVKIKSQNVEQLLVKAQNEALTGTIEVTSAEQRVARTRRKETVAREELEEIQKTALVQHSVSLQEIERKLEEEQESLKVVEARLALEKLEIEQKLQAKRDEQKLELERLTLETELFKQRTEALGDKMVAALQEFGDKIFMENVTEALAPLAILNNTSSADILDRLFKGTPFAEITTKLAARPKFIDSKNLTIPLSK